MPSDADIGATCRLAVGYNRRITAAQPIDLQPAAKFCIGHMRRKQNAKQPTREQKLALCKALAQLTGGVPALNKTHVQDFPECTYRVVLHQQPFWISVRISDSGDEYVFDSKHNRGPGEIDTMSVNLFFPWYTSFPNLKLKSLHSDLSKALGIKTYVDKPLPKRIYNGEQAALVENQAAASKILLRRALRPLFVRLRKCCFRRFAFCDTQIIAIGSIRGLEEAANEIILLRELTIATYRESRKALNEAELTRDRTTRPPLNDAGI